MTTNRRAALLFSPEAPYPLHGGGALRSGSLLTHLAKDRPVDLVLFRQPHSPDPAAAIPPGLVRRTLVIDLPANRRSTAAKAWRNAHRLARGVPPLVDRFAGFGISIERFLAGYEYQIGVIEHFWCAPYLEQVRGHVERAVLDLHNIESSLHSRCAAAGGGAPALAHRVFARACLGLERKWLPRFDELLVTSPEDASRAAALAPGTTVTVYPNAIPSRPAPLRAEEDAIVFSGNMEYHPNVSAVRFFRRSVWPLIRERWPGLVWRLVGRNPGAVQRYTSGDSRIEVVGEVEDAVAHLARAKVAVVPLLAGSGTRFKILEAWSAGTPVVSTSIGAEGLPVQDGEPVLLADTAAAFSGAVSRLLESASLRQRLGASGRCLLEQRFTWDAAAKMLHF
jgi:polysaccharide biosynthesis protein PslH